MIQYFLFLFIGLYCLLKSPIKALYLIILLLPFHFFLKSSLEYFFGGGAVFAAWKEVAVLTIFVKSRNSGENDQHTSIGLVLYVFFITLILYYLFSNDYLNSLAQLRDHFFPILLMLAVSRINFTTGNLYKAYKYLSISACICFIFGFLQMFFFNIAISTVKQTIDFVDEDGYIQYTTNSARIMGFERMSGLFDGPNVLGLFCALFLVITIGILFSDFKRHLSRFFLKFTQLNLLLAFCCLLLSFSRAGWLCVFIGVVILMKKFSIRLKPPIVLLSLGLFILVVFSIVFAIPSAGEILINSLTLKEASASERSNDFVKGLEMAIIEPWGHGLGTTDPRFPELKEFAVESAFWNITYEIGIFGLFLILLIHLIYIKSFINKKLGLNPFSKIAFALSIASLLISFVSINPYGMPYIYFWWLIIGIGVNRSISVEKSLVNYKYDTLETE